MWNNGQTMSQITKSKRFKRTTLLIKKNQYFGRYQRQKGCMSSYEKLKNNNNSLAKALSKQKQKGQILFSQNVALLAEVQDLNSACNKRDNTISKVLQNSKEMLKMLVTMTKFVTNTIASCQELSSSPNKSVRLCYPFSKDNRRLSAKSPTKGIVKPMVSGHPITKPTINLSRINMQQLNNQVRTLSTIEEASAPVIIPENSNANNDNSSASGPSIRQTRNSASRICRMPERLNVTSSRSSDGDESRPTRGSTSLRLSARRSRSGSHGLLELDDTCGSLSLKKPKVKSNDASNLLNKNPTVNTRRLDSTRNNNNVVNEDVEMNDSTNNNDSDRQDENDNNTSDKQLTMNQWEEKVNETVRNNKKGVKNGQPKPDVQKNSRNDRNDAFNRDDPLEGPSWLLNDYQNRPSSLTNSNIESNKAKNSNNKSNGARESNTKTSMLNTLPSNNNNRRNNNSDDYKGNKDSDSSSSKKNKLRSNTSEKRSVLNNTERNNIEKELDVAENNNGFVTRQRGNSTEADDDDLDEFTLMFMRRNNDAPFDENDLQLPVLEDTVVNTVNTVNTKEPEPETTTTLQKLTQNSEISSTNNNTEDESLIDRFTVKLPHLSNTSFECSIPMVDISLEMLRKKKLTNINNQSLKEDNSENITSRRKESKKNDKSTIDKDPSSAKVVLQKLNDSYVKLQGISLDAGQNTSSLSSSDSENGTMNSNPDAKKNSPKRPKRQKAPQNLKEPSLSKKLRRLN